MTVPIDGSPQADRALEYALGIPDAELTVFTVINPFDIDPVVPGYQSPIEQARMPGYSKRWDENAKHDAEELHQQAHERAADRDVPISSEIVFGSPARRIVKYAGEHDVDQIVVGTHGRTGLQRIVLGSVAETVVRRSPVNVTVVR